MYLIKEISEANCPELPFSPDIFHQAHALKADRVHVKGDGFAFDLEKVNNLDYNPIYFRDRWKNQNAFMPYEDYDENAESSLFLPFLRMFSRIFISEVNEYSVVLTGLILKYTDAVISFTDDRIRWFYDQSERLRVVDSFPQADKKTLTIKGLDQDLIFDRTFHTLGPVGAFHNVFFLQGHGVKNLKDFKYADIVLDEGAECGHHFLDGCAHGVGRQNAADDDHGRGDENINLGFLINHLAQLNRHDDSGVGSHRAAEFVARDAHGDGTEQYQTFAAQLVSNGHGNSGTRGGFGVFCDGRKGLNARLVAQGLENSTY